MQSKKIGVLVTGGNSRSGLSVARSLAKNKVSFIVFGDHPQSLAFYSRHVKNKILTPSPIREPEKIIDITLETVKKHSIDLIIPVVESTLILFNEYRDQIEPHCRLAMADYQALRSVLDKRLNLHLARSLGVPCAKQFELENLSQVLDMINKLGFPIVLKPSGSRNDPNLPSFPFKFLVAKNEAQLHGYLQKYCQDGVYPMFQERAHGEVHNYNCFVDQGKLLAVHEHQSTRRLNGVGVLRKVVPINPEIVIYIKKMIEALKWNGIANFSFFVSEDHKKIWYMETNGRFWASVESSIRAGWDFPFWVYDYFLNGNPPEPNPVKIGDQTCWRRGDLETLINFWEGGAPPVTGSNPSKMKAVFEYLSGFHPSIHPDVFRWSDPVPAFIDHWQLITGLIKARRKID